MNENVKKPILLVITIFLGWFGVDKFYYAGIKGWKMWLVKLAFNIIIIGILWNIVDIIMICLNKYQYNALAYIIK